MASGNYAKKPAQQEPLDLPTSTRVPRRATRQLPEETLVEPETEDGIYLPRPTISRTLQTSINKEKLVPAVATDQLRRPPQPPQIVVDEFKPHPLVKYRSWLMPLVICMVIAVVFSAVLLSSSMYQRQGGPQLVNFIGGKVYDIQVGGNLANTWQSDQPMPPKVPIPKQTGPYSVLGKPSLTVDFMNRVLASYHSPAAGKAQTLYDLGVKYGIDPAYALAFFLHESTFGTAGEARKTLSLGNLRCIPDAQCVDQDRGGYAAFPTWEAGFEAWYKLIRNLYVAQWGLVTVDQIIHKYAPNADNNNEQGYINALKHYIDTWHAGQLRP
ncbi:MAG: glucosaminidase domain-containing protein [Ktedonobacteraceae bacterium]|nr:glucosaminidase domain-containing protein [Ktedonobacteraceae bacterium]